MSGRLPPPGRDSPKAGETPWSRWNSLEFCNNTGYARLQEIGYPIHQDSSAWLGIVSYYIRFTGFRGSGINTSGCAGLQEIGWSIYQLLVFLVYRIVLDCINVTLSHSSTVHVALVVSCQAPMLTVCEGTEQTGSIGA